VLSGDYRRMQGRTPYSRIGEWPLLVVLGLGLVFAGWRRYRLAR
jgi:apolipoprotein N-acyltransferase